MLSVPVLAVPRSFKALGIRESRAHSARPARWAAAELSQFRVQKRVPLPFPEKMELLETRFFCAGLSAGATWGLTNMRVLPVWPPVLPTRKQAQRQRDVRPNGGAGGRALPTHRSLGPARVLPRPARRPVSPSPGLGFMSGLCTVSCLLASTSVTSVADHLQIMRNCLNGPQAGADQGPVWKKGASQMVSVVCDTFKRR